jgi:hypothetical protein
VKKASTSPTTRTKSDNRKQSLEKILRLLTDLLKLNGFTLRKEELKRGFGWKAVSGSCRILEDRIIFIDRKMTLEEQVGFLSGYAMVSRPGFVYPQEIKEQLELLEWSAPSTSEEEVVSSGSQEESVSAA